MIRLDVHRDATYGEDCAIQPDDAVHVVLAQICRDFVYGVHVDATAEMSEVPDVDRLFAIVAYSPGNVRVIR